jgi:hypothetical protein
MDIQTKREILQAAKRVVMAGYSVYRNRNEYLVYDKSQSRWKKFTSFPGARYEF